MPTNQDPLTEQCLRKRYDIKYDRVRCKSYQIGVDVQFNSEEGVRKGMIWNIFTNSQGIVIYQIGIIVEGQMHLYSKKRSDIIGIVKGGEQNGS